MYSSIYRVQSSTRRLPIQALLWFTLKLVESYLSPSPQSLCVVVCPWCQPWVASQICRFGEVSTVHIVYGELKSVRKEVQIELGKGWERKGSFCHPAAYLSPKTQDYMASFLLHSNTWQLLTGVGC